MLRLEGASDECELVGRLSLRGDLSLVRSLVEADDGFLVECDGRVLRSRSLSLSREDRVLSLSLSRSLSLSLRCSSVFRRPLPVLLRVPDMMLHGVHLRVMDLGGSRDLWLDRDCEKVLPLELVLMAPTQGRHWVVGADRGQ